VFGGDPESQWLYARKQSPPGLLQDQQ